MSGPSSTATYATPDAIRGLKSATIGAGFFPMAATYCSYASSAQSRIAPSSTVRASLMSKCLFIDLLWFPMSQHYLRGAALRKKGSRLPIRLLDKVSENRGETDIKSGLTSIQKYQAWSRRTSHPVETGVIRSASVCLITAIEIMLSGASTGSSTADPSQRATRTRGKFPRLHQACRYQALAEC